MGKIQVQFILEMLGRPPEHLFETLKKLIEQLEGENGIKIIEKTLHEPAKLPESENLYTSFADIIAELDTIEHYFRIIFTYFPANMEIISPEKIELTNAQLTTLGSALINRLHDYDALAKKIVVDNEILTKKLREVAPHLFQKPVEQTLEQQVNKNNTEEIKEKKDKKASKSDKKKKK